MRLTPATIKTLALPAGIRDKTYFDDGLGGFGLRLRDGGAARWVVQYDFGGKTKRVTLGTTGMLELGAARAKARDILAAVRLGNDPAAEKRQAHELAAETFGALLARYLPHKQAKAKPGSRSFKEVERHLTKYARSLHARPIAAIDRRAIAALMSAIAAKAGPAAANNMLGSLSGYFTWLVREGLIEINPASYVNKAAANKSRDRVLTDNEFREIWNALGDSDYADIFRLLAYTAARKTEIGGLRWNEIDFDAAEIRLPASRCKNNRPHIIPVVPQAATILEARPKNGREFVFGTGRGFTGWAWAKTALDERITAARKAAGIKAAMPGWVLHDLRRFFSTIAHDRLGVAPHIVEACLGHVSGFKAGVAGTYNKAEYLDERRRALERWAAFIDETVSGKRPATVVKLRRRR
jgi:integrase